MYSRSLYITRDTPFGRGVPTPYGELNMDRLVNPDLFEATIIDGDHVNWTRLRNTKWEN